MSIHRYTGRVVEKSTQAGLENLRVEARDLCHSASEALAAANTDARGDFTIELDDADVLEILGTPSATLYFQVLDAEDVLASTDQTHRWNTARDGKGRIEVVSAEPTGTRPTPPLQVVEGVVGVREGNTLGAAQTVKVYERRINAAGAVTETLRATTTSAADGSYRASYQMPASPTARPDLVVKVEDGAEVVATNTVCRAPARATVDVVVGGEEGKRHPGVPRFNVVSAKVTRVLSESTPPTAAADVQEASYEYVACRAEVEEREVAAFVESAQLTADYDEVDQDVFYAIINGGIAKGDVLATRLATLRALVLRAVAQRVIAPRFEDDIEEVVNDLESAAIADLAVHGDVNDRPYTSLGQLADLTPGIDETKRGLFLSHALQNEGNAAAFWTAVEADNTNFDDTVVASLRFSADVAPLVRFWPAMIAKLHEERGEDPPVVLTGRDLAGKDLAYWGGLVAGMSLPSGTSEAAFSAEMYRAFGRRFRSARIAARAPLPDTPLRAFFDLEVNKDFDFEAKRVARYLTETDGVFGSMTDPDKLAATSDLKKLERLYRLTSSWEDEMEPLLDAGLTSAHAIDKAGKAGLLTVSGLNSSAIDQILHKACWTTWSAKALQIKHSVAFDQPLIKNVFADKATPASPEILETNGIPDWTELFGTLDQCACEHCRSVLSPSAYLVDLLQFLDRFGGARDELLERRPDIERLVLSCENGETALPYVDLVNEILEVCVAVDGGAWPPAPLTIDTTRSTTELLAHPDIAYPNEHLDAYTKLAKTLHPFSLPFHLWAEEARVYLDYLGVPRHALIEKLADVTNLPVARNVAIERLNLAPVLYDLFDGELDPAPDASELWGYDSAPSSLEEELSAVPNLLHRGGITYDELLEILAAEYSQAEDVRFHDDGTCKVEELVLVSGVEEGPVTATWLERTNKLLRLRKVLGWSITDTAKALAALGDDAQALRALGAIKVLADRTKLAPLEILAWYDDLDIWPRTTTPGAPGGKKRDASFFARLFLNKAVLNPDEESLKTIHDEGTAGTIAARSLGLLPGLRIAQADFDLLTNAGVSEAELQLLPVVDGEETDSADLPNVSRIFREVSCARAAKLRIREFRILHALSGISALLGDTAPPGDADQIAEGTFRLLALTDDIKSTGASIDEIHYLVRHVAPSSANLEPTETVRARWLTDVQAGIDKAIADADALEDPSGDLLKTLIAQLFPGDDNEALRDDITALANPPAWEDWDAELISGQKGLIEGDLAIFFDDIPAAVTDLAGAAVLDPPEEPELTPPKLLEPADRKSYLARKLSRYAQTSAFVKTWIAATFAMPQDVASWLLESQAIMWLEPPSGPHPDEPAIHAFTRQQTWTSVPQPSTEARQDILMRLHKASLLVARFKWSIFDVKALYPAGASTVLPAFDLDEMPIARPGTTELVPNEQLRFNQWCRLSDLSRLRDRWAGGAEALFAFFALPAVTEPATEPEVLQALDLVVAAATGWNPDDVTALRSKFGGSTGAAYADEVLLTRMAKAMTLVRRLGASAAQAIVWTEPDYVIPTSPAAPDDVPSYLTARQIKRVAKAKHTDDSWAEIARPLRDVLRERQRASLLDYFISLDPDGDATPNDVYAHLLIDVEMSPTQLTSRLVLAHSTVQTFINRILLNLEQPLDPNEEAARQWEWMKSYRVWEANRKVFLWPENWIEPELRDDKTPLFKALETNLLQGPLDHERARDAYTVYLESLSQIANLDIVAVHEELAGATSYKIFGNHVVQLGGTKILHVFGKSRTAGTHYYRKREDGEWSPWEKIDVEIEAQHLIPFAVGGRLYLFWPQITTRAAQSDPVLGDVIPQEAGLRLFRSELRSAGWSAPVVAPTEPLWLGGSPDPAYLSFTASGSASGMQIRVIARGVEDETSLRDIQIARFDFEPGTGELEPTRTEVLVATTKTPYANVNNPQSQNFVNVTRPVLHDGSWFQRFVRDAGPAAGLTIADPDPEMGWPYAILLGLGNPAERSVVVVPRVRETGNLLRQYAFIGDKSRTIFFERKTKTVATTTTTQSLFYRGAWVEVDSVEYHNERFYTGELFYHPFVPSFRQALALRGIDGLLRWADQGTNLQQQVVEIDEYGYAWGEHVQQPAPSEVVDFNFGSPYSVYNWELFFHAPLLIATRLSQEGRYADAQKWFHYIFDPTDGSTESAPKRYWKVKPFFENLDLQTIQDDLTAHALGQFTEEMAAWSDHEVATPASETLAAQIERWRRDPFDPHSIARMRVSAYQKSVFIKYIQNLIAWGDQLFTQDSMESIAEATILYILAQELLGERPVIISDPHPVLLKTYNDIDEVLDSFSNAIVEAESIAGPPPPSFGIGCGGGTPPPDLVWGKTYFCIPPNEKLLGLWDVVGDRLFKIRHSMSIEGVVRALPLFQPPIDPALLVQAVAAGLDIASVLNDINVAAPPYRYAVLYAKAMDFIGSVTALGQSVLSTLEKQDAEALSNLRSRHEVAMNDLVREVRRSQVAEATLNVRTLEQSLKSAEARRDYYGAKVRVFEGERNALDLKENAHIAATVSAGLRTAASIAYIFPDLIVGFPAALTEHGGSFIGRMLEAGAGVSDMVATQFTYEAAGTETMESYKRRKEDWDHQAVLAHLEIEQIKRDILAGQIRLQVAEKELANVEKQIEQSRQVEAFLRTKFTNEELYGWMKGQLQALYYQAYDLAYKMAKTAQRAFQYERGDDTQTFVTFGNFDGSRAGLLAGEKLAHDLRRMDAAYHAQNKRELELTKTVSLAEHDPGQLVELRESGVALFSLTEDDYDRDFATHYIRRLKSVSVTVPCTTGPYQGVLGTLSLLRGSTRAKATDASPIGYVGAIQNIATSQGQSDSGMFEMNFRDERLLPFEGVGAHVASVDDTQWRFELSSGNRFAFNSIDDLVLDVRYTARMGRLPSIPEDGRMLRRLVRVRRDFANAWRSYLQGDSDAVIEMQLTPETWTHGRNEAPVTINRIQVYGWWDPLPEPPAPLPTMELLRPVAAPAEPEIVLGEPSEVGSALRWQLGNTNLDPEGDPTPTVLHTFEPGQTLWKVQPDPTLKSSLKDLWIIFHYAVTVS